MNEIKELLAAELSGYQYAFELAKAHHIPEDHPYMYSLRNMILITTEDLQKASEEGRP